MFFFGLPSGLAKAAVQAHDRRMSTKKKIAVKAKAVKGKLKAQRIAETGLTSRVRGHVSARGKRAQARRDAR